jgi:2-dehydro-3-deoxygluconokinase
VLPDVDALFGGDDELALLAGATAGERDAGAVTGVDPVGAGDAFVAGYLSARLDGLPPPERLRRGAVCGAFAASSHGDWEGLPHRAELGLPDEAADVAR